MNKDKQASKQAKTSNATLGVAMHRLFRIILAPFMILTTMLIVVCCIISVPLWILTGKTIIDWSCDLMTKHATYVFDGK